jgi:hypothetical protein
MRVEDAREAARIIREAPTMDAAAVALGVCRRTAFRYRDALAAKGWDVSRPAYHLGMWPSPPPDEEET